uniref:glucuronosyltransferase n=1 Tax=Leptobrachium leishanense TaxID=445787 RepID=A0A8C5LLQ8_9ANUR
MLITGIPLTSAFVLPLPGGSHYLLMDEVSRVLHNNGHQVRLFYQATEVSLPGYKERQSPFPVTKMTMDETYAKKFNDFTMMRRADFFKSRNGFSSFLQFMGELAYQCKITLNQSSVFESLKEEKFDIAVIDAFNPCTFLIAEKLGLPYIAFFPILFSNAPLVGLPTPLSYVPIYKSQLTDRMDFFQRLKNTFMYLGSHVVEKIIQSKYDDAINEHFPAESRPVISELFLKAELWFYNIDFTIEFARPLLPHVQYIGGLLAKPAEPVSQVSLPFLREIISRIKGGAGIFGPLYLGYHVFYRDGSDVVGKAIVWPFQCSATRLHYIYIKIKQYS